jgi:two-component system sensor histidine kinase EvgS
LLFTALAAQKGIALCYESHLEPKEAMQLDPQLLGQVLTNVIGNAVKFTRDGRVQVSARKRDRTLTISVSDTGQGSEAKNKVLFMRLQPGECGGTSSWFWPGAGDFRR